MSLPLEQRPEYWQRKVAAWIHDPGEKSLILMRTREGHERSKVIRAMCERLWGTSAIPDEFRPAAIEGDRWASAADRPAQPVPADTPPYWTAVRFAETPALTHPLGGGSPIEFPDLTGEQALAPEAISDEAAERYLEILGTDRPQSAEDWRRVFLRLWRLTPQPFGTCGLLWPVLPADSRFPDHSIWDHLRVCSAIAGLHGESRSLLSLALGPVQAFIAQARSVSDLWSGSHLLATLAWEAMQEVVDAYGPDSVIFPSLFGVPAVDRTFVARGVLSADEFEPAYGRELGRRSDANPAFRAALPNRFVALVPSDAVADLVGRIEKRCRDWVLGNARKAWRELTELARTDGEGAHPDDQIERQLAGFPELHWAAAPWPRGDAGELRDADDVRVLREDVEALLGPEAHSFFASTSWRLLSGELAIPAARFFRPNPGVLYPAVFECAERGLAISKSMRAFEGLTQEGYRCSLCGEREFLAVEPESLRSPAGARLARSEPWGQASLPPSWARGSERLCGLCLLKRAWPKLFADELEGDGETSAVRRYVVSTHAMALAPVLDAIANETPTDAGALDRLEEACGTADGGRGSVALPRALHARLDEMERGDDPAAARRARIARRLPAARENLTDEIDQGSTEATQRLDRLDRAVKALIGSRPETYYGLVLMDGDNMGAWLGGSGETGGRPPYREIWHRLYREEVQRQLPANRELDAYLDARAVATPSYHGAISSVLNGFASHVVPTIVEDFGSGKVIYSGGDDVLAMVPVNQALDVLLALRCAYSGTVPDDPATRKVLEDLASRSHVRIDRGHVLLGRGRQRRLYRAMGGRATASAGLVVAHAMTPLAAVLEAARKAERRAKDHGRNAFSIALAKRSGGTTHLEAPWAFGGERAVANPVTAAGLLLRLRDAFGAGMSRRAAYAASAWLEELHPPGKEVDDDYQELLAGTLGHQFRQQARGTLPAGELAELARDVAALACRSDLRGDGDPREMVVRLLGHAEFLARDERQGGVRQ